MKHIRKATRVLEGLKSASVPKTECIRETKRELEALYNILQTVKI